MDGWNTSFLWGRSIFRGYVSFREGRFGLFDKLCGTAIYIYIFVLSIFPVPPVQFPIPTFPVFSGKKQRPAAPFIHGDVDNFRVTSRDFQDRWQLKHFWNFHPDPWGNDPIWRAYFSNGLKPPTSFSFAPPPKKKLHFLRMNWHKTYVAVARKSASVGSYVPWIFRSLWMPMWDIKRLKQQKLAKGTLLRTNIAPENGPSQK